jgi:hypothetical protein
MLIFYFLQWLPRIKSFLNNERMEIPSTLDVYLLLSACIYKLYICTRKIQYYEKQENKRMLINTNLMKEGTMQVPS